MSRVARALLAIGVAVLVAAGAIAVVSSSGGDATPKERALTTVLGATRPARAPFAGLTELQLGVGDGCLRVAVADSLEERIAGLRSRSDLGDYDGMLFVFQESSTTQFTMSGVPVGLEIGFYGPDGRPVSSGTMEPCADIEARCPVYSAAGAYRYALETLRGGLPSGALSACP